MQTSCIEHPAQSRFAIVREAYSDIFGVDAVCAALTSLFENYHNNRLTQIPRSETWNDVMMMHGDQPTQDTSLYQFHTEDDMINALCGMANSAATVRKKLNMVIEKGFITVHANPNPRYHYDRKKYFIFHPEVVQAWIRYWNDVRAGFGLRRTNEDHKRWNAIWKDLGSQPLPENYLKPLAVEMASQTLNLPSQIAETLAGQDPINLSDGAVKISPNPENFCETVKIFSDPQKSSGTITKEREEREKWEKWENNPDVTRFAQGANAPSPRRGFFQPNPSGTTEIPERHDGLSGNDHYQESNTQQITGIPSGIPKPVGKQKGDQGTVTRDSAPAAPLFSAKSKIPAFRTLKKGKSSDKFWAELERLGLDRQGFEEAWRWYAPIAAKFNRPTGDKQEAAYNFLTCLQEEGRLEEFQAGCAAWVRLIGGDTKPAIPHFCNFISQDSKWWLGALEQEELAKQGQSTFLQGADTTPIDGKRRKTAEEIMAEDEERKRVWAERYAQQQTPTPQSILGIPEYTQIPVLEDDRPEPDEEDLADWDDNGLQPVNSTPVAATSVPLGVLPTVAASQSVSPEFQSRRDQFLAKFGDRVNAINKRRF